MIDLRRDATAPGLVVVNPNTSQGVSDRIRAVAAALPNLGVAVTVVNPEEGPLAIESPDDRAIAEPLVIDLVGAAVAAGSRGVVLACFDNIGADAARRLAPGPVLDACTAGVFAARAMVERFAIVTTVETAVPRIERLIESYGAGSVCSVRAAGIGVVDAASGAGEERLQAAIAETMERDGAEAIVLGSGGLTGQADGLSRRFGVPFIDGVAAAITVCAGLLRLTPAPAPWPHRAKRRL